MCRKYIIIFLESKGEEKRKMIKQLMKIVFLFGIIMAIPMIGEITKAEAAESTFNYTVKSGETITSIATKYQMGSDEIQAVNPGVTTVYAGQVIKIPDLSNIKSFQEEVVRLTNVERSKVGVAPLTSDWKISRVARYKANDMRDNNYFSHYSPTYGDPFVMMQDFGISFNKAAENIAARQSTPSAVVQSWMNSDSHRENMLSPAYKKLGVGYSSGGYLGTYWVQMFTD